MSTIGNGDAIIAMQIVPKVLKELCPWDVAPANEKGKNWPSFCSVKLYVLFSELAR